MELWRSLDQNDPEIRKGLAFSLCNLGEDLVNTEKRDEALKAEQESVELWKILTNTIRKLERN